MATWSQFTFLSQAQRNKLQEFADLGASVPQPWFGGSADGDVPPGGPVPTPTYSQAKAAVAGLQDFMALYKVTMLGVRYTLAYFRKQALDDFDADNP